MSIGRVIGETFAGDFPKCGRLAANARLFPESLSEWSTLEDTHAKDLLILGSMIADRLTMRMAIAYRMSTRSINGGSCDGKISV